MTAVGFGTSGVISIDTMKLFFFGLPVLLAGTWIGLRLYGYLDEAAFRKVGRNYPIHGRAVRLRRWRRRRW